MVEVTSNNDNDELNLKKNSDDSADAADAQEMVVLMQHNPDAQKKDPDNEPDDEYMGHTKIAETISGEIAALTRPAPQE